MVVMVIATDGMYKLCLKTLSLLIKIYYKKNMKPVDLMKNIASCGLHCSIYIDSLN